MIRIRQRFHIASYPRFGYVPKNLLKYLKCLRLVTGHDFSRADKSNQINRALAPEGRWRCKFRTITDFFNKLLKFKSLLNISFRAQVL